MSREATAFDQSFKLRQNVQRWIREQAERDLKFAGEEPWKNIPASERETITKALLFYAESGAARAFDALKLHGHLTIKGTI